MIATRSCRAPDNAERVRLYRERVTHQRDYHYLSEAGRIASGVRLQGELVRLPVPRHRALVPYQEPQPCQPMSLICATDNAPSEKTPISDGCAIRSASSSRAADSRSSKSRTPSRKASASCASAGRRKTPPRKSCAKR